MVAIVGRADKQMAKTRRAPERGSTSRRASEGPDSRRAPHSREYLSEAPPSAIELVSQKLLDVFDNKLASVQAAIDRANSAFSSLLAR